MFNAKANKTIYFIVLILAQIFFLSHGYCDFKVGDQVKFPGKYGKAVQGTIRSINAGTMEIQREEAGKMITKRVLSLTVDIMNPDGPLSPQTSVTLKRELPSNQAPEPALQNSKPNLGTMDDLSFSTMCSFLTGKEISTLLKPASSECNRQLQKPLVKEIVRKGVKDLTISIQDYTDVERNRLATGTTGSVRLLFNEEEDKPEYNSKLIERLKKFLSDQVAQENTSELTISGLLIKSDLPAEDSTKILEVWNLLKKFKKLRKLIILDSSLPEQHEQILFNALPGIPNLQDLRMIGTKLKKLSIEALGPLSKVRNLTIKQTIGGPGLDLGTLVKKLPSLTTLELPLTFLRTKHLSSLASGLSTSDHLIELDLSDAYLDSSEASVAVNTILTQHKNLEVLKLNGLRDFSGNSFQIRGEIMKNVIHGLEQLPKLKHLYLKNAKFETGSITGILKAIQNPTELETLDLEKATISLKDFEILVSFLPKFPKLKTLSSSLDGIKVINGDAILGGERGKRDLERLRACYRKLVQMKNLDISQNLKKALSGGIDDDGESHPPLSYDLHQEKLKLYFENKAAFDKFIEP